MKKFKIYLIIFSFNTLFLYGASSFDEGKEYFESNNVEEAVYLFEEALITDPSVDTYKYLSESYNILGMHDDEILVLEEAVSEEIGDLSYFYFKLGNAYQLVENYTDALSSFNKVLELNKQFVNEAFLNIANVSVALKQYSSAIDFYTKYLELESNSPQKRKIVKAIFILKKMYKEQLATQEEEQRALEDARIAAEAESIKNNEERLTNLSNNGQLIEDREQKARELAAERLLYESEAKQLAADQEEFRKAEELVLDPPDPEIEEQRTILELREQELLAREERVKAAEEALKQTEAALSDSSVQSPVDTENSELAEFNRKKQEEEQRQQDLMNEIMQSLEKIGENAKGINASSEGAYDELEGSGIDE